MKIVYIANAIMPTAKAHGYQIVKTCEAFMSVSNDIGIELLVPNRKSEIQEDVFEYYSLRKKFKITKIFTLDFKNGGGLGLAIKKNIFSFFSFLYIIFKAKADIYYCRQDLFLCVLLMMSGKKVAYENHEPRRRFEKYYAWWIKRIKKKIVVAYNIVDIYKKYNTDEKTYIIAPNGVDITQFDNQKRDKRIWEKEFGLSPKDKIILYVGHFYGWKGVYTLIESAKFFNNNIKIVLIGGNKDGHKEVNDFIKKNNIKNIFLKNFIPHNQIIKYIKSADVLALPNTAKEKRSAKYTTPIKLFEYMASGIPVVASDLDSFRLYLRDNINCVLFRPDNSNSLAEKIKYLIDNLEIAKGLANQAYKESRKYTWEKRAEKILKFIKE